MQVKCHFQLSYKLCSALLEKFRVCLIVGTEHHYPVPQGREKGEYYKVEATVAL